MNGIIIDAINTRMTLTFFYNGESREVEPHCYGLDNNGHEALRAFQINKGWRMFHVSEIAGLRGGGRHFSGPRPGYAPGDSHMAQIFAQI